MLEIISPRKNTKNIKNKNKNKKERIINAYVLQWLIQKKPN